MARAATSSPTPRLVACVTDDLEVLRPLSDANSFELRRGGVCVVWQLGGNKLWVAALPQPAAQRLTVPPQTTGAAASAVVRARLPRLQVPAR